MKFKDTILQHIEFGEEPQDQYYCLVNKRISPGGLDISKMRLTDPRNIDREFRQQGMVLMFTGDEIESMIDRGDLDRDQLHESLYELAKNQGVLSKEETQS